MFLYDRPGHKWRLLFSSLAPQPWCPWEKNNIIINHPCTFPMRARKDFMFERHRKKTKTIIFTPPCVIGKKGVIGDGGVRLGPLVLESSQHHYWQACHHLADRELYHRRPAGEKVIKQWETNREGRVNCLLHWPWHSLNSLSKTLLDGKKWHYVKIHFIF